MKKMILLALLPRTPAFAEGSLQIAKSGTGVQLTWRAQGRPPAGLTEANFKPSHQEFGQAGM